MLCFNSLWSTKQPGSPSLLVLFIEGWKGLQRFRLSVASNAALFVFVCVCVCVCLLCVHAQRCMCTCFNVNVCVCVCLFVQVDDAVFCAGQIALVPCSMQLVAGGAALQAQLCFSHMAHGLEAVSSSLTLRHALQAHCYVTQPGHVPAVRAG